MSRGNKNTLVIDIDDQNAMYVFAFKSSQVAYLNLNLQ